MTRRQFLRYDLIIQGILMVLLGGLLLTSFFGETWDEEMLSSTGFGLLVWLVISFLTHLIWAIRNKEKGITARLTTILAGGAILGIVFMVGVSVSIAILFFSFFSQDTFDEFGLILFSLAELIALAYFVISLRDYRRGDNYIPPVVSVPTPSIKQERQENLVSKSSFLFKPHLPFLIPNVLTIICLLVWASAYDEQLGEYNWMPVILSIVSLSVGLFVRRIAKPSVAKLNYAELGVRPPESKITIPTTQFGKVYNRFFWVAVVPLLLFGLSYLPPLRKYLIHYDLKQVSSFQDISATPLGLAQKRFMYAEPYAPDFLRDTSLINTHLRYLNQWTSAYYDFDKERTQLTLYYAALRLQGNTPEQIWRLPMGKQLIIGTLLAENYPPYWWKKADWLQKELNCQLKGAFQLGLIDESFAKEKINQLLQDENTLRIPANTDSTSKVANLTPALVRALMQLTRSFPNLATKIQKDKLLSVWKEHYTDTEFDEAMQQMLANREAFRQQVASYVRADGSLSVSIKADISKFTQVELRQQIEKAFEQFVIFCGYRPVYGTGVSMQISLEDAMHNVPYTTRDYKEIRVIEQKRVYVGGYRTSRYETRTYEHTDYKPIDGGGRGLIHVPMITLTVNGKKMTTLPYGIVNKNDSDRVAIALQNGKGQPMGPADSYTKIVWYYYTLFNALTPWQLGVTYYEDPENQLFWDGFEEELQSSRF